MSNINAEELAQKFHDESRTWSEILNRPPPPPWERLPSPDRVTLTRAAEETLLPIVQELEAKIEQVEAEADKLSDWESTADDLQSAITSATDDLGGVEDDLKQVALILEAHEGDFDSGDDGNGDFEKLTELIKQLQVDVERISDELAAAKETA